VSVEGKLVRFIKPSLVEEYSVTMGGVRQDFVVLERPQGTGDLIVRLNVTGSKVKEAAFGAVLVLESLGERLLTVGCEWLMPRAGCWRQRWNWSANPKSDIRNPK